MLALLGLIFAFCYSTNALTAVQQRALLNESDFFFDLFNSPPELGNGGGEIRRAFVTQFPALEGQGLGYTHFILEPCGVNLPHVHPRATELLFVIDATQLRTILVEENCGQAHCREISSDLKTGQVTFFPQGLIHMEQNLGCENATFISALNSEDPGVNTVTLRLFDVSDDEALATSFNLTTDQIQTVRNGLPPAPAKGRAECLQRCGLCG